MSKNPAGSEVNFSTHTKFTSKQGKQKCFRFFETRFYWSLFASNTIVVLDIQQRKEKEKTLKN